MQNSCGGGTINATPGAGSIGVINTVLTNAVPSCTISVAARAPAGNIYTNSVANISGGSGITTTGLATSTLTVIAPTPAVIIKKSAQAATDPVDVGTLITYTMLITNSGNLTLTNVTVSDALPGISSALSCSKTLPTTLKLPRQ